MKEKRFELILDTHFSIKNIYSLLAIIIDIFNIQCVATKTERTLLGTHILFFYAK